MAVARFFVRLELSPGAAGQSVELPEAALHHATRVVRLGIGDSLTLFNGTGGEYAATITRIDRRGASVRIESFDPVDRESPLAITLALAIPASDAMDYAIRKATELGVTAIQPLMTARSAPIPAGDRAARRYAHWRQVAIGACEQCGRNRVPDIAPPQPLDIWVDAWRAGTGVILLPDAPAGIAGMARPSGSIVLLIGPEGGWSPVEVASVVKRGFTAIHFGPRVLRSETAGVAALAVMQARWGDCR